MSAGIHSAAEDAYESFRQVRRFGSLDGLRCLSIIAVIWHHGPGLAMDGIGGRGFMGVRLFFAISGFLITTLLLRERERNGSVAMRGFYIRRSLRIFPLYFGVLAVYCVLLLFLSSSSQQTAQFYGDLPYFLTYTSNWFVGQQGTFSFAWSLAAEEQFYATWPWALKVLDRVRASLLMAGLLIVVVGWQLLYSLPTGAPFALVVLDNIPMAICWGSLAACLLHGRRGFDMLYAVLGSRWMPPVILCVTLVLLQVLESVNVPGQFLLSALVVSCVVREDHFLAPLLKMKAVVYIGTVSYGMYMLHGLVYVAQGRSERAGLTLWDAHGVVGFAITLLVVTMVATLSYRHFEFPFLRVKEKFAA